MAQGATSPLLVILYRMRRAFLRVRQPLTLGVRCIVARPDGCVLLVRHTYVPGWHLPGGGVKRGEKLEDAVAREVKEEAGVELLSPPRLLNACANFGAWKSDYVITYVADRFAVSGHASFEIAEAAFFDPDDLPAGTSPATVRRLQEWRGELALSGDW